MKNKNNEKINITYIVLWNIQNKHQIKVLVIVFVNVYLISRCGPGDPIGIVYTGNGHALKDNGFEKARRWLSVSSCILENSTFTTSFISGTLLARTWTTWKQTFSFSPCLSLPLSSTNLHLLLPVFCENYINPLNISTQPSIQFNWFLITFHILNNVHIIHILIRSIYWYLD